MKSLKIVIVLVVFTCFYSCIDDDPKKEIPYYEFDSEDFPFLMDNYNNANMRLEFKNQDDDEVSFILNSFERSKESYTVGGGGFGPPSASETLYYHDVLKIEFTFEQYNEPLANLKFWFSKNLEGLHGSFQFPLWNIDQFYIYGIPIDFQGATSQMTIDGVTFNKVISINSGATSIEYSAGTFDRNVHVLYYDLNKGLIGFDDLDGGEWRLDQ